MWITQQMKLSALLRQPLKVWLFTIYAIDWRELQCRMRTEGDALSAYFTYYRRIYLPFIVILPFFTNYEIAAPFIPNAFNLSFSIFPGNLLGMTMQLVIISSLDFIWKGIILIYSFWKCWLYLLQNTLESLCQCFGTSLSMKLSILLKMSAKLSLLLSSTILLKLLMPFLTLPSQLVYEMGTTLKPILYLNSSIYLNNFSSRQSRVLQLSPLSYIVSSKPVNPVMVLVVDFVKKQ